MNKTGFSLILISFLLLSVVNAAIIDSRIEEAFNEKETVKVLVKLKDSKQFKKFKNEFNSFNKKNSVNNFRLKQVLIKNNQEKVLSKLNSQKGFMLGHKYSNINGFSAKITRKALNKLMKNSDVEFIQFDNPVKAFLDNSIPLINASTTWDLQSNGINITGSGETICIVDTGIDYTHPALGGCSITKIVLNGTIENLTTPIESNHPYSHNTLYNWTINRTGYSSIAIHFKNLSVESNYDQLKIYDKNGTQIGSFSGRHDGVWSPHAQGDTIRILWQTDPATNDYGIYIDKVINGTTNTSYDWSNCQKIIGGWDFVNSDGNPYDDNSHGTHCAGISASENETYRGVAYDANLLAVKVLDDGGSGTDSDVAAGVDWCINQSSDYNISAISMSLGCSGGSCTHWQSYCDNDSEVFFSAEPINTANSLGIPVLIAAGNDGWTDGISSPACVSGAIPVGAVNDADTITYNRGSLLSLLAPGVSIRSTIPGTSFGDKSGTSMATPHVAGAAVLLRQFYRLKTGLSLGIQSMKDAFNNTGKLINDSAGSGLYFSRINVYDSIRTLDIPIINFTTPTPTNNTITSNISIDINISAVNQVNNISFCTLEWNYTNETMDLSGSETSVSCYKNKNLTSSGFFHYKVFANDTFGNIGVSDSRYFNMTNSPPNITSFTPNETHISVAENSSILFNHTSIDINNDSLTYNWTLNLTTQSVNISWTYQPNYTATGGYNVTLFVSDGKTTTINYWNLTVNNTDTIPSIISFSPNFSNITFSENTTQLFNHTSSDEDSDTLSYSWLLNGSEESNESYWSYTPNFTAHGSWNITLIVSDTQNNTDSNFWNITITDVNAAPIWNSVRNHSILPNETLNYSLDVSDLDGDNISFWVNDTNVSVNNDSLTLNYDPENFSGDFNIEVTALDNDTNTSVFMNIIVNYPPVFNKTIPSFSWNENSANNNAFDLDDYFYDLNDNSSYSYLDYSYLGNSNIVVSISSVNVVSFSQPNNWDGQETVIFSANDDYNSSDSNSVSLMVNNVRSGGGSGGGSSSSSTSISIPKDSSSKIWSRISSGELKTMTISREELPLTKISFELNKDVKSAQITVKKIESPAIAKRFSGKSYVFLEINKENVLKSDIEEANIEFEVSKEWLANNSLNEQAVAMFRYVSDWLELNTIIVGEDKENVFFKAETPSFSFFAIGEKELLVQEEVQEIILDETKEVVLEEKEIVVEEIVEIVEEEIIGVSDHSNKYFWLLLMFVAMVLFWTVFKSKK